MLETERQNRESDNNEPAAAGSQSQEQKAGGQGRGLLRRARRAVTRPAGPPQASDQPAAAAAPGPAAPRPDPAADSAPAPQADSAPAAPASAARKRSRAARPAASAPPQDAADPAQEAKAAQAPPKVPAATFQPPLVIFQPPDIAEAREPASTARARQQAAGAAQGPGRGGDGDGAADRPDDGAGGQTPASRRSRSRASSGAGGEAAGGTDDGGASQHRASPGSQDGGADAGTSAADDRDGDSEQAGTPAKRRRRGGRGHAKGRAAGDDGTQGDGAAAAGQDSDGHGQADGDGEGADSGRAADGGEAGDGSGKPVRRRRRRQRSGTGGDIESPAPDDPPDTVVHVRPPRAAATDGDDVRSVKGSTRLEAKRQRRRDGRDSGRRRPPIITESEFLARREAVERVMVVRQHGERTQIAVMEDGVLVEHYVDKASHQSYVGNVYLGKVQNVLPSMEAAFVDIGKGRNAVLYAGEVNFDASGLEGVAKRIESALKSGQSILVQVTKDPIGHKGARLTSQVSLPGRYLVYVPGASMTGISRKLPDTERTRLKHILKQVMPENAGVIVRTAAEGASEEELAHDVARLSAQWEAIERKAKTATAPALLYSEPDLTLRVVRDIFNEDFTKLVIASDSDWDMVDEYVRYVAPNLADRMKRWNDDEDLFAAYRLDEQLAKALDRKVWLPSGGSLVIDTTEAMTVIDVNTGKFTGQGGNLEQTVTRNNLEAAEEIVRQLRLRDVGGIIVIDFIDMVLESNRDLVLRRLIECLARDRTKHQVAEVTSLGLVQMTRKRVGSGLLEAFSVPCEHCGGRGVIISLELADHVPPRGHAGDDRQGPGDRKPKEARPARGGKRGGTAAAGAGGSGPDGGAAASKEGDVAAAAGRAGETASGAQAPRPARARSGRATRAAGKPDAFAEDGNGGGGADGADGASGAHGAGRADGADGASGAGGGGGADEATKADPAELAAAAVADAADGGDSQQDRKRPAPRSRRSRSRSGSGQKAQGGEPDGDGTEPSGNADPAGRQDTQAAPEAQSAAS
jgi:ribonuclease E